MPTQSLVRRGLFTIAAVLLTAAQHANAGQECTVETRLTNCLDGVSSGVSGGAGLRTSAARIAPTKASEASQDDRQASHGFRFEGRAAGETVSGWGLWGSFGYNEFDGAPVFGGRITPFDTELVNGLVGADIRFGERIVLGAALGYEDSDTSTVFNAGSIETDGFTIAPYALFILNDWLSLDLAFGYSRLDNAQSRVSTVAGPTFLTSAFDSERRFISTNLTGTYAQGNWLLGAQAGVLRTREDQDAYTDGARTIGERELTLSQGHLSVDVGYSFGAWEPYARAGYYHDFSRDDGQNVGGLPGASVRTQFDANAWRFAAGLRYYGAGFSGNLELETEEGRDNFDSTSVIFSIRADF